ncbi:hypothetical protein ACTQ9L_14695 [Deinococcus wulumuqiensis]
MKLTISAKLKLRHNAEQKAALDAVTLAYRDALNSPNTLVLSHAL